MQADRDGKGNLEENFWWVLNILKFLDKWKKDQESCQVSSAGSPEKFSKGKVGFLWVYKGYLIALVQKPWHWRQRPKRLWWMAGLEGSYRAPIPGSGLLFHWEFTTVRSQLLSPCLSTLTPLTLFSSSRCLLFMLFLFSLNEFLQILFILILFYF